MNQEIGVINEINNSEFCANCPLRLKAEDIVRNNLIPQAITSGNTFPDNESIFIDKCDSPKQISWKLILFGAFTTFWCVIRDEKTVEQSKKSGKGFYATSVPIQIRGVCPATINTVVNNWFGQRD